MGKRRTSKTRRYDDFRKAKGIGVTYQHEGKMRGMVSLSTSCTENPNCIKMHNANATVMQTVHSVDWTTEYMNPTEIECHCTCNECYSFFLNDLREDMREKLCDNAKILQSEIIPVGEWVHLNKRDVHGCFRLESFGDVANETQVINYFNFALTNPNVTFVAWTKQYWLYDMAVKNGNAKPDNFVLIISSPFLNVELDITQFPLADRVFTVYTYEWIVANDIRPDFINCGARSCIRCMLCYIKGNGVVHIREILKEDSTDVHKYWVLRGWMTHEAASLMLGRKLGKQYSKRMREHEKTMYYITEKRKADRERRKAERMALKAA